MENLKEELEELENRIKRTLDVATATDNLKQLKFKFELAKADLNKYCPNKEKSTLKEIVIKYAEFTTTYKYFENKLASKIFELVEQKTKKALEELTTADDELCYILNNNLYCYASKEHQEVQRVSNRITSIYLQLKELLMEFIRNDY